jgi:acyl-CoA thioesterase
VLTLADATTPRPDLVLDVAPGWRQGRGAYGGLSIASAIRAIERTVADPRRRVRSVTAELPAPTLEGTARFEVEVLRTGSSVTVARAALHQADGVTCHAVAVLAAERPDGLAWCELTSPSAPAWHALADTVPDASWPEFTHQFAYRLASGTPFTGGSPVTIGWVKPRAPGPLRDAAYVAALIDAWWPAVFVRMDRPRPLATISYTLELVSGLDGLADDAPLLYRGSVAVAGGGYFLETRELWGDDGRLVARNHQTFVVIR